MKERTTRKEEPIASWQKFVQPKLRLNENPKGFASSNEIVSVRCCTTLAPIQMQLTTFLAGSQ